MKKKNTITVMSCVLGVAVWWVWLPPRWSLLLLGDLFVVVFDDLFNAVLALLADAG